MLVFVDRHVSFPGCIWKRTFLWTMGVFDDLLGVQPSVLGDVSSCTFVLVELASKFVLKKHATQTNQRTMGDWSLPKKHGDNFCGRPLCCRAASTRCSGFSGQKSKTSRVVAVANLQVWMEEFMKHIHVCIKKKSYLHTRINKNFLLNFCQTSMHFFWDCTGFEGIYHPFAIHLRRTKNHPLPTERPFIIQVLIGPVAVGNLWMLQKISRRIFHILPDLSVMFR